MATLALAVSHLSNRQVKSADRFTGAIYVLPWPAELPQPKWTFSRAAALPAEAEYAQKELGQQLTAAGINILDIEVTWQRRQHDDGTPPDDGPKLLVYVLHKRWPQNLDRSNAGDHARWIWLTE